MPLPDEVKAIIDIAISTNKKLLRYFRGIINYYRDMWKHRLDILNLFNLMTSEQAIWKRKINVQKNLNTCKNNIIGNNNRKF